MCVCVCDFLCVNLHVCEFVCVCVSAVSTAAALLSHAVWGLVVSDHQALLDGHPEPGPTKEMPHASRLDRLFISLVPQSDRQPHSTDCG